MQKISRGVLKILANSFTISAVSLLIAFLFYLANADSVIGSIAGLVGWYGFFIIFLFSVYIFSYFAFFGYFI